MTELDESLFPHFVNPLLPRHEISKTFFIARATAILVYASYEQSLVSLFAYLMGVQDDYAGVPFFKINNARARIAVIERLLKKRHGNAYNVFWNPLVNLLKPLDEKRNQVIHWAVNSTIDTDQGGKLTKITLVPPNFTDRTENTPEMTLNDLYDFIVKCDFLARSLNVFHAVISRSHGVPNTWHDICQQPVTYPPQDNHPLFQKPQAQQILPESS